MAYLGDIAPAQILYTKFVTTAASTGAPTTPAGSPAISVYKDDGTTESTSGVTLSTAFDGVAGLNNVKIDTSSDGTFYAAGHDFQIVITTGTVGGVSAVGYVVGEFSINNRVSNVTRWNGTAVATPATAGIPDVNVKNMNNVAATSITTINANIGLTQPLNFTGTGSSALAKSDMVDIAGAAVSTTTAQIGVNAVQINAVSTSSVTTINANQGTTQPVNFTGTAGSALVKGDTVDIAGAAVSATTAQIGVNVVNWNNTVVATPATAGIPDINVKNINNVAAATPGASGGILISGSNSGTTTLGALTITGTTTHTGATVHTGNVSMAAGLTVTQSTTNGHGISIAGNGTGSGITSTGGATGNGVNAVGGATSGFGIKAIASAGNSSGMYSEGVGDGHGYQGKGGTAGSGIYAEGGTAGDGIAAQGHGVGAGMTLAGGNTAGPGFLAAGGTGGTGGQFLGASGQPGLQLVGTGSGAGMESTGGATGHGTVFKGGATSGNGLLCQAQNGNGIGLQAIGQGTGAGMECDGGSNADGADFIGGTTDSNAGIFLGTGATNGEGLYVSGTGTGRDIFGTGSGGDVDANIGITQAGADKAWDTVLASHLTPGSTGEALDTASTGGGDPWATALPGAYGAGTAGKIVGDNVNATISSRLAASAITLSAGAVTVGTNNDKTGYALSGTQTFNTTGNITGNLSGSVGSVTGAVGSVTGNVGGNVAGSVGSVTGSVGSVVADVGITQAGADKVFGASGAAMAELTGVPAATPSPRNALMLIFMALRNRLTTTATTKTVYDDAGSAIASKTLSDNSTTYNETKMS